MPIRAALKPEEHLHTALNIAVVEKTAQEAC